MFKSTRNLVRLVAALTLVAAFVASPATADAGNFKGGKFHGGKFHGGGNFHHKHNFRHNHFGFHGHRFHKPFVTQPIFVGPNFARPVIAVPTGSGVVFVVK